MNKVLFRAGLLAFVLISIEAISFAALRVLVARGVLSDPPAKTQRTLQYDHYLEIRRDVLGWPLLEGKDAFGGDYRDETGARRLPAFPNPNQPACLSIYGDSFAESVMIDAAHTWSNLVARELGCRVANYAQAGYGTDQALLRHRLTPHDQAPVVILSHMVENVRRNLTRIRDLVTGGRTYEFKPRFIVDTRGRLELLPLLELSEEEYEHAVGLRSPLLPIEHETFQPGGPLVARSNSFPFLLSLIRATSDYRVRARVRGNRPWYAELYEPGNVTQGHELMVALAGAFMDQTHRRGQKGLLLFLPPEWVLRYHSESGYWIHQPLLNALDEADIPYLDFGPFLESHSVDPINEPFIEHDGHYGQEGDRLLAKMILAELRARFPEAAAGRTAVATRERPQRPMLRPSQDELSR